MCNAAGKNLFQGIKRRDSHLSGLFVGFLYVRYDGGERRSAALGNPADFHDQPDFGRAVYGNDADFILWGVSGDYGDHFRD